MLKPKKLIDNVVGILESGSRVMIIALKINIKTCLVSIRAKKENENKGAIEMKRAIWILSLILMMVDPCFSADLTPGEKRRIGSAAEDALREIISLWKDGKYEELYECGHRTDRVGLSKESFIRQMKNKSWGLATSWETIQDVEADVESRTLVYVRAKVGFKRKTGGDTRLVTLTFQMIFGDDRWRTSLFKILWSP